MPFPKATVSCSLLGKTILVNCRYVKSHMSWLFIIPIESFMSMKTAHTCCCFTAAPPQNSWSQNKMDVQWPLSWTAYLSLAQRCVCLQLNSFSFAVFQQLFLVKPWMEFYLHKSFTWKCMWRAVSSRSILWLCTCHNWLNNQSKTSFWNVNTFKHTFCHLPSTCKKY